jgi:cell division protein FtsB
MSNEEITALQAVEKAAKRRRVDRKKEWYVAEWARLLDENERLKQEINRLRNRGFWARVFNR